MAIDRDATLKKAEKFLRQGRLDQAIAEYLQVIKENPRDWSTVNAAGDLLVRAGQTENAIEHYARIADHFFDEGFLPRAAAVYKKILKLKGADEHAALRAAEISEKQGLLADAKSMLVGVADRRLQRGDKRGAAEIHLRLGALDPADVATGITAAKAAAELGNVAGSVQRLLFLSTECVKRGKLPESLQALDAAHAIDSQNADVRSMLVTRLMDAGDLARATSFASSARDFKAIAAEYYTAGKGDEAMRVLEFALERDPADGETRRQLVRSHLGRGDLDRARSFVSGETTDPELLLSLVEIELRQGNVEAGRDVASRTLSRDPTRREELVLLGCRLCEYDAEGAFQCIDVATDAAIADNDWPAAASALHEYATRVAGHVPALMKLVEVCVDGGLEATMYSAQAQLADAYLKAGRGNEARVIAEDLVAREPWEPANIERFRSALVMLGEPDADSIIADRLSGDSPFTSTDITLDYSFNELAKEEPTSADATAPAATGKAASGTQRSGPAPMDLSGIIGDARRPPAGTAPAEAMEFDLSDTLNDMSAGTGTEGDARGPEMGEPAELDRVFEGFRKQSVRKGANAAGQQYRQALAQRDAGDEAGAIKTLEQVARSPRYRFKAASELARLHRGRGRVVEAIEWFERAAESAPADTEENRQLLYDLGLLLIDAGESDRALAVFLELQADTPDYRDVAAQVERLSQKA